MCRTKCTAASRKHIGKEENGRTTTTNITKSKNLMHLIFFFFFVAIAYRARLNGYLLFFCSGRIHQLHRHLPTYVYAFVLCVCLCVYARIANNGEAVLTIANERSTLACLFINIHICTIHNYRLNGSKWISRGRRNETDIYEAYSYLDAQYTRAQCRNSTDTLRLIHVHASIHPFIHQNVSHHSNRP